VVDDNLRVVKRGYTEIHEIPAEVKKVGARQAPGAKAAAGLPIMLKRMPENEGGAEGRRYLHRFWEQTGNFYVSGKGSDNLADPFMGMALIPAVTGVFRDMTQIRFEHPEWIAENCTACGNCYTQCPDSAIPGLVSTVADVLNTAITNIEMGGRPTRFLRKGARNIEKKLRGVLDKDGLDVRALLRRRSKTPCTRTRIRATRRWKRNTTSWKRRSVSSSSPPPSPIGPTRRRRPRAAAACSRSPSTPTPARAAPCASTSATTTP
jgi:ferredoxin